MPHLLIEYSASLDTEIDLESLMERMHAAALDTGIFPLAGLRTRCSRRDHYRIADNHPDNAFVHATMRIGYGRSLADRTRAADEISAALFEYLSPLATRLPLALSLEIQEIDPHTNRKCNNLRDYLAERAAANHTGESA